MLTNAVAPDKLGGLERYVRELAAWLVRSGVPVTVHAKRVNLADPAEELGRDGVLIHRHAMPPRSSLRFGPEYLARSVLSAAREAARRPGAVLHAHYAVPALPLALRGRRYLYTFHAPVHRELLSERVDSYALPGPAAGLAVRGLRAAERLVVRRAAEVVVLSKFMQGELAQLDRAAAARSIPIPGGVDLERFYPGATRVGGGHGAPLLFSARRFTPRTGVRELLQALPAVRRSFPEVSLALAGEGRTEMQLQQDVTNLGLDGSVQFLGRVSDEELVGWYRRADLVVIPTQELEGFGLATAEALACGTPVVATPVGANPELLSAISQALLTRDASPGAIADAVVDVLSDESRRESFGAAARERARAYDWNLVADRYLSLYESALQDRPAIGPRLER
jgi:glycosyltransferase involved in cell wall biosynthesis